jgi:hypothetical protein
VDGTLRPPDAGSFGNPTDVADALLRTSDCSLVGFASPSFDEFAFVASPDGSAIVPISCGFRYLDARGGWRVTKRASRCRMRCRAW